MQKLIFYLLAATAFSSCTQKGFVKRKVLLSTNINYLFCDIYQTGIDNYTFSFCNSVKSDTAKLFEYYLNDAAHTALRFNTTVTKDTFYITLNMKAEERNYRLPDGVIFQFTGIK